MAFERGQNKLGVGVPQRFKGRAAAEEVFRKSGQTEREELRKPKNKRIRKRGEWFTGSKPAGKMQIGRAWHQPSW